MKNYFCLFIFIFSISFQANAQEESSSNIDTGLSGLNIIWNSVEVVNHIREIFLSPSELASDSIYHMLELVGHTGNIMNYFDETTWSAMLTLLAFNGYAVTVQYRAITRNLHDASRVSKLFAALGTIDFLGHFYNVFYIPYVFSQNKA